MNEVWEFRARLNRVVDGDTVDLNVDLGFRTYKKVRVRLHGVDTSEIFGAAKDSDEYETGMEQMQFTRSFLTQSDGEWPLIFVSRGESGKYGRWIGDIEVEGKLLTAALCEKWPEVHNEQ